MANLASNTCCVTFKEDYSIEKKKEFFEKLHKKLPSLEGEISNPELEEYNQHIIYFGSSWSEPTLLLQELSEEYQCNIIGVCYEFGCQYVNHFEFKNLKKD